METVEQRFTESEMKVVELAKDIVRTYVVGNYPNNPNNEKILASIDAINEIIDFGEMDGGVGGTCSSATGKIGVEKGELPKRQLKTLLHELGHFFSAKSRGANPPLSFEEGMAEIFEENAINYYLVNGKSAALQELGFSADEVMAATSAYIIEREFVKTSLEVVRQSGKDTKTIEYEYWFGDKGKVWECLETVLGDEYIALLDSLQREEVPLKKHDYNNKLKEIMATRGIELKMEPMLEDGSVNMYLNGNILLETVIMAKEMSKRVTQFYTLAMENPTFEALMQLRDEYKVCNPQLIQRLVESQKYTTLELMQYIESFKSAKMSAYSGILDLSQLTQVDIGTLSAKQHKDILILLTNGAQNNEELLNVVNDIEVAMLSQHEQSETEITPKEQLYILRSKYLLDPRNKGQNIAKMFDVLKGMSTVEGDSEELDLMLAAKCDFEDYLSGTDDKVGRRAIVEFFASFHGKEVAGQIDDPVSMFCKENYYSRVYQDLRKVKSIMLLDPVAEQEIYVGQHYSGKEQYLPMEGLTIDTLARVDRELFFVEVFNKQNVRSVMKMAGIGKSYTELSKEEQILVLDVLEEVKDEPEYIEDISKAIEYVDVLLATEPNETIASKKNDILSHIANGIAQRETIVEDISKTLSSAGGEFGEAEQYVCGILTEHLRQLDGELPEEKLKSIAEVTSRAKAIDGTDNVRAILVRAMTGIMRREGYTTQRFLETTETYYGVDEDVLIQSYLESIDKGDSYIEKKLMSKLRGMKANGVTITNPQYIEFEGKDGEPRQIILLTGENGMEVYSGIRQLENDESCLERENKRKKGLFSIFKSKKAKEKVVQAFSFDEDNKQVNIYETGRIEIATLAGEDISKVVGRSDAEVLDIGKNAMLIETPEITQFEQEMVAKVATTIGKYEVKPPQEQEPLSR